MAIAIDPVARGQAKNAIKINEENIFSEKQIFNQGVLSTKYEFVNNTIEVNESTTLSFEHISKLLKCVNTSNITITIPNDTSLKFLNETLIEILRYGDGEVSIVSSAGVIINSVNNLKNIADKYSAISLKKMGDNEWLLIGNLKE